MANPTKAHHTPALIKTPQELIHIRHKITLFQYKLWVLMLRAYRKAHEESPFGIEDNEMCYVSLKDLKNDFGYQPKTAELEDDFETIRKEPVIFNVLEKDRQPAKTGTGFISTWFVSSNKVGVTFPPIISHAVKQLGDSKGIFQLLNWNVFNSFPGKHEAILYKLCKDYVRAGKTRKFSIQQYREYMGIPDSEYTEFKRLNQWVISGPIKAINESKISDIRVEVKLYKENRRVTDLEFFIESVATEQSLLGDAPAFQMARILIPLLHQKNYLQLFSSELIAASIDRANEYIEAQESQGKAVVLGAIYRTAIEEKWGESLLAEQALKKKQEELSKLNDKANNVEKNQKTVEKLKADFIRSLVKQSIDSMTLTERRLFLEEYQNSPRRVGTLNSLSIETTLFRDKYEANLFKAWLRTEINPVFDETEFSDWLVKEKKIDPETYTPLPANLTQQQAF